MKEKSVVTPVDVFMQMGKLSKADDEDWRFRRIPHLEAEGYQFPPIDFDIDPESDWYRFEHWIKGLPIRKKLKDQLLSRLLPTPLV